VFLDLVHVSLCSCMLCPVFTRKNFSHWSCISGDLNLNLCAVVGFMPYKLFPTIISDNLNLLGLTELANCEEEKFMHGDSTLSTLTLVAATIFLR